MKKKTIAISVLVVALFLLSVYFSQNSSTSPGQEPLTTLTSANFVSFEETFDRLPEGPRLLLLLSPT